MISRKDVWRFVALALALSALLPVAVFGGAGSGAARTFAALPAFGAVRAHGPAPWQFAQPLENGSAVKPAPRYTTLPSARTTNDPHWRAPNVRANTDTTTYAQQEPVIVVNPLNHLNVVAGAKDERRAPGPGTETKEVWMETSTDGGLTWPFQTHIPMPNTTLPQQSDPVLNFSDDNTVYMTIIGLSDAGGIGTNATMVARSTDGGITWQNAVYLNQGQGGSDKEWTAVDLSPTSPYYHRIYTTWTNFAAGPQIIEKWSSDNGVTWNPPGGSNYVTVSFGSFDTGQFSMPVTLPNGDVIVTWYTFGQLAVARSTNGGQSFINPNTSAVAVSGVNTVPGAQWRLNTIPSTAASQATGTIVSVWPDGRHGKDDIYFTRSTNGGVNWSPAARVAHNAVGSSYQVEPWISVAPNGRFDVIWYDDRDFPTDLNSFHIYATHSTDDGATWTGPDEQVTDAPTNLNIGIPTGPGWNAAAGDYINVTSANDMAYAIWTDTRSGNNEDIYTSQYLPILGTPTPTVTGTPPTDTPTVTPTATPTNTNTPRRPTPATFTNTPTVTPTYTPPPATFTNTPTVTYTATPCTISFTDVHPEDYFYEPVTWLYCHGAISGYGDGTFRPYNNTTRGQLTKIVVLAEGWQTYTPPTPTFRDVPATDPFYTFIETAYNRGIISGYSCGNGCLEFRPGNNVTRAQLCKIVVLAEEWTPYTPPSPTFRDVPTSDPFYTNIETAYNHGIISGYTCGTSCLEFRPGSNATRGQISKIVYLAVTGP